MNFKDLLKKLGACEEAIIWAGDMPIEEVVKKCHRGDWLLWLAKRVDMDIKPLTLAKARCAKTVIHLMTDQRSINAVNLAEKFGVTDEVTLDDLRSAFDAAYAAATYAAAAAAAYAAATYADAADATYATYAAAAAAAAARIKNQKQTADICRETFGKLLIALVNNKLK